MVRRPHWRRHEDVELGSARRGRSNGDTKARSPATFPTPTASTRSATRTAVTASTLWSDPASTTGTLRRSRTSPSPRELLLQFRSESSNLGGHPDWIEGGINAGSRESGVVPGTPEMHTNRFPLKVILWVSSRASSGLSPGNRGPVVIPNGAKDRSCAAGGTLVLSVQGTRMYP